MKEYLRNNLEASSYLLEQFRFPLTHNTITAEGFEWVDEHEFLYKGELYDVINKTTEGNTLQVYCIKDESETLIVKKYESLLKKTSNDPVKKDAAWIQLIHCVYIENSNGYNFNSCESPKVFTGWLAISFNSRLREIIAPPPRQIIV